MLPGYVSGVALRKVRMTFPWGYFCQSGAAAAAVVWGKVGTLEAAHGWRRVFGTGFRRVFVQLLFPSVPLGFHVKAVAQGAGDILGRGRNPPSQAGASKP